MRTRQAWLIVTLVLYSVAAILAAPAPKEEAAPAPKEAALDKVDTEYSYGNYEYDEYNDEYWEAYYEEEIVREMAGGSTPPAEEDDAPAEQPSSSTPAPTTTKSTKPPANIVPKTTKKNQLIGFIPGVELINGIDDVSPTGNCSVEFKKFCKDVKPGKGRLAACITEQMLEDDEEDGGETDKDKGTISDDCKEEVMQYKILRNQNINSNIPLARACKKDADKLCNVTWFFGYKSGQVIACLRDEQLQDQLSKRCKRQVFRVKLDAAFDYRADALLYEACNSDAGTLCKDVRPGMGRVQACLRKQRLKLSWVCEEQLFRQEAEDADDIRLSFLLFRKCMPDKRKFCADVQPGNANVKECLEEHRNDPDFSPECKEEIDAMIERRVHDFRLDSRLEAACDEDIHAMCPFFGDLETLDADDSSLVHCLQDYAEEIKNPTCKAQVMKYKRLASEDIRFDLPLADACYEDRNSLCANVPPGSARVIRCLESQRDKLSATCRATLFDEEVRFSENIDFQFPMKQACTREIQTFCKTVPHGHARVIRCLQDNKMKKNFGAECRKEVTKFEQGMSEDYRLNFRLKTACEADIGKLCKDACKVQDGQVCGGNMLRCLTEKKDQITSEDCAKEVFYFEKMEVTDYRNDVLLANACRDDVKTFCEKVEPGDGRVHQCLRQNRAKLSPACKKEELALEQAEAENIELRPTLLQACADERQLFCKDVQPGAGRVFRCLAESMGDLDFSDACRHEVRSKLARRQYNWKLDPSLRRACKDDVAKACSAEDAQNSEEGLVIKCLIKTIDDISSGCAREVGRAVHMAFFTWQEGNVLTKACDQNIKDLCLKTRPNAERTPGAIGTCLAEILEASDKEASTRLLQAAASITRTRTELSPACYELANVAEPPNIKSAFDASFTVVSLLHNQLSSIEDATGVRMVTRDGQGGVQGMTLSGWTAMAAICAFLILVMYGAYFGYRRWKGLPDHDYTLVVKGGGKGRR